MLGILFAVLATAAGLGITARWGLTHRAGRLALSPTLGLASMAVVATWSEALHAIAAATVVALAAVLIVPLGYGRPRAWRAVDRRVGLLLGVAILLPAAILGV